MCNLAQSFYPRTIPFRDTTGLVINDWHSIPSDLHQLFYVTLLAYYTSPTSASGPEREISLYKPSNDGTPAPVLLRVGRWFFLFFSNILLAGASVCFLWANVDVSDYVLGFFFFMESVPLWILTFFCWKKSMLNWNVVETDELEICYTASYGKISGTLTRKKDAQEIQKN